MKEVIEEPLESLKRLKEELIESQHRPESQPTPFVFEPPIQDERPMRPETLPTPLVDRVTPLPELQSVPMVALRETIPTPWSTLPTPKLDAADCLFISDPTPVPRVKDVDDAVLPALTQPTPVPEKGLSDQREAADDQEKAGTQHPSMQAQEPVATVSLDVVAHLELAPKAPRKLNFAAMLLQKSQAASAMRQAQEALEPSRKGFLAHSEEAPESTHPPARAEDLGIRATI